MSQKEKNNMAFRAYIESKDGVNYNGNAWWFQANVRYINHKTGNVYGEDDTNVHAGNNYCYGDIIVHAECIEQSGAVYVEWSTNFNIWTYNGGVLKIEGDGPKGKYTIIIV